MTAIVELESVRKDYGSFRALHSLDLTLAEGEVLGFLGPNGAGKTTTIRIVLGLLRATSGSARLFGRDCWQEAVDRRKALLYKQYTV